MRFHRRLIGPISDISSFKGYRFPPDVIILAVRWYLRYGLSYRDVEELLAERGIEVDHVTLFSLGTTFHAVVDRRRTTMSASSREQVVR